MAISITNSHNFFQNKKNISIIFKDFEQNNSNTKTITKDDFVLIFSNEKIVGINIFNYEKYFQIKEGFHSIDNNTKTYLLNKFSNYLKEEDFDSFYKIGKVVEIKQHSSNPNLSILKVQFKFYEKQIITNLKNIEQNKNYLFAIDGAITSSGLKIVESKISNTLSQGMIMSYKSLGIDKEGIVDCSYLSIEDEFQF